MKRNHKHAEILRWVADGEDIECSHLDYPWRSVTGNEVLQRLLNDGGNPPPENRFRIKPKMIKCGDMEFPAPCRFAPNQRQHSVTVSVGNHTTVLGYHETKAAAEAHAKALIALTEVRE